MVNPAFNHDSLREKEHKMVASFVEGTVGIQMPKSKMTLMETRLRKRQKALGHSSLKEYIHFTLGSPEGESEKIKLIDALTTNKTDFYREPEHFSFLRQHVKQYLFGLNRPINIWSAGCSSGEEPYTLAMEMMELQTILPRLKFKIWATDISEACLKKAKNGIYTEDDVEPVPLSIRKKYLLRARSKADPRVCIAPEVAECVDFAFFNLLGGDYLPMTGAFDVIFCRNVMIYFCDNDRAFLAAKFAQSLRPSGIFCIGHSEVIIDQRGDFRKLKPTVYQKVC